MLKKLVDHDFSTMDRRLEWGLWLSGVVLGVFVLISDNEPWFTASVVMALVFIPSFAPIDRMRGGPRPTIVRHTPGSGNSRR